MQFAGDASRGVTDPMKCDITKTNAIPLFKALALHYTCWENSGTLRVGQLNTVRFLTISDIFLVFLLLLMPFFPCIAHGTCVHWCLRHLA